MANENKIKHLEFIQNIITRMGSNSFMIKGWCITLVSALFALSAKDTNVNFALIAYMIISCFWLLDGFFIVREKHFRELYDKVRIKTEEEIDYSLTPCKLKFCDWITEGVVTYTLVPFYGIMIIATFVILYFFANNTTL